jgi:hypothetical protein
MVRYIPKWGLILILHGNETKNVIMSPERSEGTASGVKNLYILSVGILRSAQNDRKR